MRQGWGDLLSIEGRSLDIIQPKQIVKGKVKVGPSVFDRWKKLLPETLSERLDSGYKVFKNNPIKFADNVATCKRINKTRRKKY